MNDRPDPGTDAKRDAIAEVLADGHVEIDLADPPPREELGLVGDADDVYLENRDLSSFTVTVTFSDGHVLTDDKVNVLRVRTDDAGEIDRLMVGVHELTLEEVGERLQASVEDFGVAEAEVRSYLTSADDATELGRIVTANLRTSGIAAPESMEIEPVVNENQQNNLINYRIAVDTGATS